VTVRTAARYRRVLAGLGLALGAAFLLGVAVGAVWVSPMTTLRIVAWKLGLTDRPEDVTRAAEVIVLQLRLPRVVLAGIVGGALAASGTVFQGLFRNALADPAIIGVSSGAALGAVVVIVTVGGGSLAALGVPLAAFAGATVTAFVVYRLARIGPAVHVATLLLAGIAVAAVISSLMSLVMSFSGEAIRDIYAWLLGGLVAEGWRSVALVLPAVILGLAGAALVAHELNLVALGEERAAQLGIEVDRLKRRAIAVGALLAAAAVSVAGVIGFVGLMTPHLLRLVVGADHRRLLPASVLGGATLLILADVVARTVVAPAELPVGVVTALLGGPFFLFLLRRQGRSAGARA
jgi:iron complex transport system permease protein